MPKALYFAALVGFGGFIGTLARYGLSLACEKISFIFPLGTLGANFLGCFFVGVVCQMAGETGWVSPASRLFWATGFCGGLSTLSALAYETVQFTRSAEWFLAGSYLLATVLGSFIAFGLGSLIVILWLKGCGALWN